MAIVCPNCQHTMNAKDAKPGRYRPTCVKCGKRFVLTIFADRLPQSEALPSEALSATAAPVKTAPQPKPAEPATSPSVAKSSPARVQAPKKAQQTVAVDSESTAAWNPQVAPNEETKPHRALEVTAVVGTAQNVAAPTEVGALPPGVPSAVDGYRIVKELGRGAMGAVYLAKQLSLDRDVALKTIQPQWAADPAFIARFTREAYAAAQLTHHNVIQIYDLGTDAGLHFFSMEFVRGVSLDETVREHGRLDAEVAVGYVLQAARGLQFAHGHGMVHRDVKPANLLLSDKGIVKVADLGIVKTSIDDEASPGAGSPNAELLAAASAERTMANIAMGTPAYMAPEQAENAAGVDHRADIYSLGCTLYVLLTGRPPFQGASAMEVFTKHRSEPIVRPDAVVKRIPKGLSEIVLRMVAKRPEERYSDLGEVIGALENLLGIQSGGPFSPREEHAQLLEECLSNFNAAPAVRWRRMAVLAFSGACLIGCLGLLPFNLALASGMLGLLLMTAATYFVVSGLRQRSYLFEKIRALVFSARVMDWLTWIGGGLVLLVVLFVSGWFWYWVVLAGLAVGVGLALHFVLDRRIAVQRQASLDKMNELLRTLRLKGLDEVALRQFVAKYSGNHWEEFYEALFGYPSKLEARAQLARGEQARGRRKFRGWREPVIRWIDERLQTQREARDRKHLQKVEENSLQAQGLDLLAARKQAQRVADALLDEAADMRATAQQTSIAQVNPGLAAVQKRARVKTMLAEARAGKYEARRTRRLATAASPLTFLLGPQIRFLLGCALLLGFALWARQNALFSDEQLKSMTDAVVTTVQERNTDKLVNVATATSENQYQPLNLPVVGGLFNNFNPGVAGLMLIVLGMMGGWKLSLFALPAAAIMVLGPTLGLPDFGLPYGPAVISLLAGLALAGVGVFIGRSTAK